MNTYRKHFPSINNSDNKHIYFDNACVTLKTENVIKKSTEYYEKYPACHNRSIHSYGKKTSSEVNTSREAFKKFINAKNNSEVIFTKNTTESLNMIARGINFNKGDSIVTTSIEHNSNLLPWQVASFQKGLSHKIIDIAPTSNCFEIEQYKKAFLNSNVKIVSVAHVSHVTGMILPIKEMIDIAHENGALFILDAAQSMTTHQVDVQHLDIDFLATSIHKMFGPSGVGILYGKQELLEKISPTYIGGETVINSTFNSYELAPLPARLEYGLQNYSGIISSQEAISFINQVKQKSISENNLNLNKALTSAILQIPKVKILGPIDPELRPSMLNFQINDLDMGEISILLDKTRNIMTRSGVHCAHAWYNHHQLKPSLRISFSIYNTIEEVEVLIETLSQIKHFI